MGEDIEQMVSKVGICDTQHEYLTAKSTVNGAKIALLAALANCLLPSIILKHVLGDGQAGGTEDKKAQVRFNPAENVIGRPEPFRQSIRPAVGADKFDKVIHTPRARPGSPSKPPCRAFAAAVK